MGIMDNNMKKKFTVSRCSGFGDYVNVVNVISSILGEDYEFVVSKSHKYKNYYSPDTDFIRDETIKKINQSNDKFVQELSIIFNLDKLILKQKLIQFNFNISKQNLIENI